MRHFFLGTTQSWAQYKNKSWDETASLSHDSFAINSIFTKCNFTNCKFDKIVIKGLICNDCIFHNVSFNDCTIDASNFGHSILTNCTFNGCFFLNAGWNDTVWKNSKFIECILRHNRFLDANFDEQLTLEDCDITDAVFSENKTNITFKMCNQEEANLDVKT